MDISNKQQQDKDMETNNSNFERARIYGVRIHYLELVFVQPSQSFLDNPRAEGVYYKKGKDWVYTKIDTANVSFGIELDELKDIEMIISQFKSLNPMFTLNTVKYI